MSTRAAARGLLHFPSNLLTSQPIVNCFGVIWFKWLSIVVIMNGINVYANMCFWAVLKSYELDRLFLRFINLYLWSLTSTYLVSFVLSIATIKKHNVVRVHLHSCLDNVYTLHCWYLFVCSDVLFEKQKHFTGTTWFWGTFKLNVW